MSMISEQVKRLRKLANQWKHNDVAGCNLIFEAADTIEALSAKVRAADIQEVESATILNEGITFSYRKTGEWIYAKEQLEIVPMWECSCCRTRISKKFNYCPNCGAKMLGEDGEA